MAYLLEIRAGIISAYRKYENYIVPAFRFLVVFAAMRILCARIGYSRNLSGLLPSLIVSLVCTLMPAGGAAVILGLVAAAQFYFLALEVSAAWLVFLLLLLLLYFRFSPKDGMLLLLYPVCFALGIPYVLPLAAGLLFLPSSAVTCAVGIAAVCFGRYIAANESYFSTSVDATEMAGRLKFIIDGIAQNRQAFVMIGAAAVSVVAVYIIRRLVIRYSWHIAVVVGAILQLIVILLGDMRFGTNISVGGAFLGTLVSIVIAEIIVFFLFNLDYSRIEDTQFEDDEYYYYVKAIPKMTLPRANRRVKQIYTSRQDLIGRLRDDPYGDGEEPYPEEDYDGGDYEDEYYPEEEDY